MAQPNPFAQAVAQPAAAPVTQDNPFAPAALQQAAAAAAVPAYAPPVAAPPALDPSALRAAGAPAVGEGRGARLAHMYGRLALIFPLALTVKARSEKFITPDQRQRGDLTQEQITATFVVLDDGQGGMQPIRFGGDPTAFPPVPDNETAPLPYVRKGLWVTQSRIISQLRDSLPAAGRAAGMVCGRVVKTGPAHNDPWYITTATDAEVQLAQQYLQLVASGQYPHPLA